MRLLTVRPPWAQAIVDGHKAIENRAHSAARWSYRGEVAIHAALRWSERGRCDPRITAAYGPIAKPENVGGFYLHAEFDAGVVLGVVDLVDVHPEAGCCEPWGEHEYQRADGGIERNVTHLVFENPRRFDCVIPAAGRLGLWKPHSELDVDLVEAIADLDLALVQPSDRLAGGSP